MSASGTATRVSPEIVLRLLSGRFLTQIVMTTKDLGLFDALSEIHSTAAALSARLELPEERLQMLLDANVALGLMIKEGMTYELTPTADSLPCLQNARLFRCSHRTF